jgi:hypothetical protein
MGLRYLDSVGFDHTLPPCVAQLRLDLRLIAGRIARFVEKWETTKPVPVTWACGFYIVIDRSRASPMGDHLRGIS